MADRRNSIVTHIAKAISVSHLQEKVTESCPEDTPIPSKEWIRLQFSPVCLSSYTALPSTNWPPESEAQSTAVAVAKAP